MKFIEKIKKTYAYYKSLGKEEQKPQEFSDLNIRPDTFAFLTAPYPILPNEKETQRKR